MSTSPPESPAPPEFPVPPESLLDSGKGIIKKYVKKTFFFRLPLWLVLALALSHYRPDLTWIWPVFWIFVTITILWTSLLIFFTNKAGEIEEAEKQESRSRWKAEEMN